LGALAPMGYSNETPGATGYSRTSAARLSIVAPQESATERSDTRCVRTPTKPSESSEVSTTS
jgi:hypothetical protein